VKFLHDFYNRKPEKRKLKLFLSFINLALFDDLTWFCVSCYEINDLDGLRTNE